MVPSSFKMEAASREAPCAVLLHENVLIAYIGDYLLSDEEDWLKTMTIRLVSGRLYLDLKAYTALEMCPDGVDVFMVRSIRRRLVFCRDEEGRVSGLIAFDVSALAPKKGAKGRRL